MLFSKEDLKIDDPMEFVEHLPIFIFCALVLPFIGAAYGVGFVMDQVGWLKDS